MEMKYINTDYYLIMMPLLCIPDCIPVLVLNVNHHKKMILIENRGCKNVGVVQYCIIMHCLVFHSFGLKTCLLG